MKIWLRGVGYQRKLNAHIKGQEWKNKRKSTWNILQAESTNLASQIRTLTFYFLNAAHPHTHHFLLSHWPKSLKQGPVG